MKLIIVSGLSGAGKTIVLHTLEDTGAYCVDNLPVSLLPAFAQQAKQLQNDCVAVGIDARTASLHDITDLLQTLTLTEITYEILFLEADDSILIKRFSETRRKHPLTTPKVSLVEAIKYERKLLEPLANQAHIRINTTHSHVHQLRDRIRAAVCSEQKLTLLFESFGFKYGLPSNADFIFDTRCLPNPHWETGLRALTGLDEAVMCFLANQPKVQQMQNDMIRFLEAWLPQFEADNRCYLTVAIGCTGGQHRSVYLAEQLTQHFTQQRKGVLARHRELP